MFDLSPSVHCNTFQEIKPTTPLLIGLEFSQKAAHSYATEWEALSELEAAGQWDFDLQLALPYLQGKNSAIVVTDPAQKITWVSQGFRRMTGYGAREALGRRPNFLQGEKTSVQTRQQIGRHIAQRQFFSGEIVNYRKSGEAYLCAIQLFSVHNDSGDLVNFIALEKEKAFENMPVQQLD